MKTISFIVQTVMISSCLGVAAGSLQGQSCKDKVYGHENQIDPNPIELQRVAGKALLPNGTVAPRICVGIFTESEHKLLRYGETDESGQFVIETTGLPDGDYRLVGLVPGFLPSEYINQNIKPLSPEEDARVAHERARHRHLQLHRTEQELTYVNSSLTPD